MGRFGEMATVAYRGVQGAGCQVRSFGEVALQGTKWRRPFDHTADKAYLYWRAAVTKHSAQDQVAPYKRLVGFKNVKLTEWLDWKWQLQNAFKDPAALLDALGIGYDRAQWEELQARFAASEIDVFPMKVTPAYAVMIDPARIDPAVLRQLSDPRQWKNPTLWKQLADPIFMQTMMHPAELHKDQFDVDDPLHEDRMKPTPAFTHRYPDRGLLEIIGECSTNCRHCTRRRRVGGNRPSAHEEVRPINRQDVVDGIRYVAEHPELRDVLISGGDPLLRDDEFIEWVISELEKIPHVEVIRIGTRTPVVLPQRITPTFVEMLKRHQSLKPIWLNTHFNHPQELANTESRRALALLADAGIPLGNQSVLLEGINNDPAIMMALVHGLVKNRVRPYYIYMCDLSMGISHFRTAISDGLKIMAALRGHTSGLAVPMLVIDAPGGGGKVPFMPQYGVRISDDGLYFEFENYATLGTGEVFQFPVKDAADARLVKELLRLA